jgi:CrcB protein
MVIKILLIALSGACGTLARFGISEVAKGIAGGPTAWGTVTANALGSFLFGLVWAGVETRGWLSSDARVIILAGFMGAFTTFSTYIFETSEFMRQGHYGLATANVFGQAALGFACMILGLALGR